MKLTENEITDIWNEYYPRVYGYFFKRVSDSSAVDDLTSLTLSSYITTLNTKEIDKPMAYLWQIARNQLCLYIKSKSKTAVSVEDIEIFEAQQTTEENEISTRYRSLLEQVLLDAQSTLTSTELDILRRSYFEGQSSAQIALDLNQTPGNIRQILSRTLTKLKTQANQLLH
jgi:RNA polymerase sigma factor (sigma-70 family)